jgi:RHS repeat-associated protein
MRLDRWRAAELVRDPRGYQSTVVRNSSGLVAQETDARGNTASWSWIGPRLLTTTLPNGAQVNYEYNGPGQRLSREYGTTAETRYFYTSSGGRVVLDSVHIAGAGTMRFTYDTRGRLLTERDSAGHTATIAYEPTGWQSTQTVTTGGGRVTRVETRDAWGRATQVRSPDGQLATTAYDVMGRVTSVTAPDGGITRYHYGAVFLDSLGDARGQVYRWTRNQLGWAEREARPGDTPGQHLEAAYDRWGRVASSTDRRGVATSYVYDRWDRPTLVSTSHATIPNRSRTFAYSPDTPANPKAPAWVYAATGEAADTVHTDTLGRPVRMVTRVMRAGGAVSTVEVQYTYNLFGARDSVRYRLNAGSLRPARYQVDPATALLTRVYDFSGGQTSLTYNGEGALAQVAWPNGVTSISSYTNNHRLGLLRYSTASVSAAGGFGYEYDEDNRISARTNGSQTRARDFAYDPNGRLLQYADRQRSTDHSDCYLEESVGWVCPNGEGTTWSPTGLSRTFAWDSVGNPQDSAAVTVAGNRLTQYRGWTLQYDAEGNLLSKTKGTQAYTYVWDGFGQLAEVRLNGALVATYGYDGQGRRVRKTLASGTAEHYVYDEDDPLLDLSGTGSVLAEYTYYPGTDLAHSVLRGTTRYYYATDDQGTVLALVNASGSVVNQYRYDPFGGSESATEGATNRLRWIGREWDASSGLYYVRARWYDPTLQRFVSEDPVGIEGGINLYAYAGDDPVNFADRTGLLVASGCDWEEYKSGKCTYAIPGITANGWQGLNLLLASLRMSTFIAGARACEPWRCQDDIVRINSQCLAVPECAATLHSPRGTEPTRLRNALRGARDDGFCGQAKAAAQDMLDRGRIRVYDYRLTWPNGERILGESPEAELRNGQRIRMIFVRSTSINGPTVLHEAMHSLIFSGRPARLQNTYRHLDPVPDMPEAGCMQRAAFICANQPVPPDLTCEA